MSSILDTEREVNFSWEQVVKRLYDRALAKNGVADSGGPKLTNSDAIALIDMMREEARAANVAWPSWYQLAAIAYGYGGPGDTFDDSPTRMESWFDEGITSTFWEWIIAIGEGLDKAGPGMVVAQQRPDAWYSLRADAESSIAADGGECRVPLPGIPPDQWPRCPGTDPDKPIPQPPLPGNPITRITRGAVLVLCLFVAWKLIQED